MSMEIHVLFRGKLPGKPALAQAMKELGFPITIPPPRDSLEKQKGFLPMKLNGEHGGAEFDVFEGRSNIRDLVGRRINKVEKTFERCANFRWSGDENEMMSAMCASAALAKLVGGVVLEAETGDLMSTDKAIAWAKKHLADLKPPDRRFGTRPSDVKRYLKPLLKLRDDLVLVGRYLVIRPVRHVVRGALLDYYSKDRFRIWCYLNPLYAPGELSYSGCKHVANCSVWEPHFEELLMDGLAEDVFAKAGSITTLSDFATGHFDSGHADPPLISFALDGQWDRAAAYFEQTQKDETLDSFGKEAIKKVWERVSGNIEAVCVEAHAKEAEAVKHLKLEHIWEPSPFPVELPAAQRSRVGEPAFSAKPWIPRPQWLLGEMPSEPGEVAFGKSIHRRDGRDFLVVPLAGEQAKKRHDATEPYFRAERLADGTLLRVGHDGEDLNDPERFGARRTGVHFTWEGPRYVVSTEASQDFSDPGVIELSQFYVRDRLSRNELWLGRADRRNGEMTIYDSRSGEEVFSKRPLTDAERVLVRCPLPQFGDYAELLKRARTFMQQAGFDPWA